MNRTHPIASRPAVDRGRFTPAAYHPDALPPAPPGEERLNVLHLGASGVRLAAEALLIARRRDPRLHLLLGDELTIPPALGGVATALGPLQPDRLAQVYATADLLLFADPDDPFARPVLEAQASGLPVLAVAGPGTAALIEPGRTGCLVEPTAADLGAALAGLALRAPLRDRLATGALLMMGQVARAA